jgi:hypothetical protein
MSIAFGPVSIPDRTTICFSLHAAAEQDLRQFRGARFFHVAVARSRRSASKEVSGKMVDLSLMSLAPWNVIGRNRFLPRE